MKDDTLIVKDAKILFGNLNGRGEKYNPPGRRYLIVVIEDEQLAERLRRKNWRIHNRMDKSVLQVFFMEGAWPDISSLSQLEGKTLIFYGFRYKVETVKGLRKGVKPFLSGVNDTVVIPTEHKEN